MLNAVYLGQDLGYWQSICQRLEKDYHGEEFHFHSCFRKDLKTFQKVLLDIVAHKPDMIFVDFSVESKKVLTVARTLSRIYPDMQALIGLWNYLAPKHLIDEGNTTGVIVTHIKSGEIGEVVRHAMLLCRQKKRDEFVNAKPAEDLHLKILHKMKIGYITSEYLHVEHNVLPPKGTNFELSTNLFGGKFLSKFTLVEEINENFYYNLNYSSNFKIIYNPETEPRANETEKQKNWRIKDDAETEKTRRNKLTKWIDEHKSTSIPKRTKLLVIDEKLSIIDQADRPLDHYPYSIRFLREIDLNGKQLKRLKAGIICYQCPPKQEGQLRDLMAQIESMEDYDPFVVVFQSSWTSDYLKDHFSYERIMGQKDAFDLNTLLDFCKAYETNEGRSKSHSKSVASDELEKRVYIDKYSSESEAEYSVDIGLNSFTESWFKFQCLEELPLWSIYFVDWPLDVCLTVVEELKEGEWKKPNHHQYLALVHCIGEKEKAEFRRQINDTIHKAKLAKEEAVRKNESEINTTTEKKSEQDTE